MEKLQFLESQWLHLNSLQREQCIFRALARWSGPTSFPLVQSRGNGTERKKWVTEFKRLSIESHRGHGYDLLFGNAKIKLVVTSRHKMFVFEISRYLCRYDNLKKMFFANRLSKLFLGSQNNNSNAPSQQNSFLWSLDNDLFHDYK